MLIADRVGTVAVVPPSSALHDTLSLHHGRWSKSTIAVAVHVDQQLSIHAWSQLLDRIESALLAALKPYSISLR